MVLRDFTPQRLLQFEGRLDKGRCQAGDDVPFYVAVEEPYALGESVCGWGKRGKGEGKTYRGYQP